MHTPLLRFTEMFSLGIHENPHTDTCTELMERVTVCPSCRSLHSLRQEALAIICLDCTWSTPVSVATVAA